VLRYASSLSIKDSPINLFIWYDQVRWQKIFLIKKWKNKPEWEAVIQQEGM
jgi:hypothetical protein